jgi:hypothetical protein
VDGGGVIAAPAINSVGERMSTILHDPAPDLPGSTHIMIATTCYDRPSAEYTFSLAKTRQHLTAHNVQSDYYMLSGNCHVDDARNQVVADFLHTTDCEYLLFHRRRRRVGAQANTETCWGTKSP